MFLEAATVLVLAVPAASYALEIGCDGLPGDEPWCG